jgi:sugar/nucleoside kinase (ribokinase family)
MLDTAKDTPPKLAILGDCNPDLVLFGDVVPTFGQVEKLVDRAEFTIGGSGSIAAVGASKLGLEVALFSVVGDDAFGRFMLESLDASGIDVRGCVTHPRDGTGITVVLTQGEDRAILTFPGTIASGGLEHFDIAALLRCAHIHLSSFFLQRGLAGKLPDLFETAHDRGVTVSVDPNWDPLEDWDGGLLDVLELCDFFLPNAEEVTRISGVNDVTEAARRIASLGPVVIVKMGPQGARIVDGDTVIDVASPGAFEVVDTVGAGDSFDAGFLAGHLRSAALEDSVRLACACGSLSVRERGGTGGQPALDEAMSLARIG